MDNPKIVLREAVGRFADQWLLTGLPSRQEMDGVALRLNRLRDQLDVQGLWEHPPAMVTATLDDGIGQGLAVIEAYAAAMGIRLISLGLLQTPEVISDACHRHQPDYLGLTILQFDTEDDLKSIAENLPVKTRIIAGGPVFSGDPDFAGRTGTHHAVRNLADFLRFMLSTAA